jgi:hypothetical protein
VRCSLAGTAAPRSSTKICFVVAWNVRARAGVSPGTTWRSRSQPRLVSGSSHIASCYRGTIQMRVVSAAAMSHRTSFTIDGTIAMHLASTMTLSGIALAGVPLISLRTSADYSMRLVMSDLSLLSSAAQPTLARTRTTAVSKIKRAGPTLSFHCNLLDARDHGRRALYSPIKRYPPGTLVAIR